ncbi:MAG TPA: deoxyribonuclease IV [Gemmatimonadales bacterium]|nr:deoxyribonuclease IV [Gemmatimonadales bacterium]
MARSIRPLGEMLGAHVSAQGGVQHAPARAAAIGATAFQLFTKTPNQWREPVIDAATGELFRLELERTGIGCVVAHDSYLINLASPDPALQARSAASFRAELARCEALGIRYLVSHPGNYMDNREAGLERNAAAYARCLERVPGSVMVLLESTAGSGTALGATFEELAELRARIPASLRERVGFCADTCHLHAAGYDLVHDYEGVWQAWDRVIGGTHLRCLHLNDSKTPLGSHRDRHELIAEGTIGADPFRRIMRDPRFRLSVKIIETPKGDDPIATDRRMLRRLRAYARGTVRHPR